MVGTYVRVIAGLRPPGGSAEMATLARGSVERSRPANGSWPSWSPGGRLELEAGTLAVQEAQLARAALAYLRAAAMRCWGCGTRSDAPVADGLVAG